MAVRSVLTAYSWDGSVGCGHVAQRAPPVPLRALSEAAAYTQSYIHTEPTEGRGISVTHIGPVTYQRDLCLGTALYQQLLSEHTFVTPAQASTAKAEMSQRRDEPMKRRDRAELRGLIHSSSADPLCSETKQVAAPKRALFLALTFPAFRALFPALTRWRPGFSLLTHPARRRRHRTLSSTSPSSFLPPPRSSSAHSRRTTNAGEDVFRIDSSFFPGYSHRSQRIDGKVYALGGMGADTSPQALVRVYEPVKNQWLSLAPMPTPRYGAASFLRGNKIYVLVSQNSGGVADRIITPGGRQGKLPVTALEAFDLEVKSWTRYPMHPQPQGVLQLCCHRARLLQPGWPAAARPPQLLLQTPLRLHRGGVRHRTGRSRPKFGAAPSVSVSAALPPLAHFVPFRNVSPRRSCVRCRHESGPARHSVLGQNPTEEQLPAGSATACSSGAALREAGALTRRSALMKPGSASAEHGSKARPERCLAEAHMGFPDEREEGRLCGRLSRRTCDCRRGARQPAVTTGVRGELQPCEEEPCMCEIANCYFESESREEEEEDEGEKSSARSRWPTPTARVRAAGRD
ncbi:hypothetical protein P4O66_004580 [Electrophorus voltai]|uniref:Kelch domain-containing protein 8B n=1 Tax=Electrophorus voltai TaxID=2609070 RepID=A0AAD8ZNU7_9TELE|nr:hypothetical protein P4O66_004580 [Electrophorus voltai]